MVFYKTILVFFLQPKNLDIFAYENLDLFSY